MVGRPARGLVVNLESCQLDVHPRLLQPQNNEIVAVARTDGSIRFGQVQKVNGDGTLEIKVGNGQKRLYFVGSIGKILI